MISWYSVPTEYTLLGRLQKPCFVLTELHCDIQAMRLCMRLCDLQGCFFETQKHLFLRPQNALILRPQNCLHIGSRNPVTPKLAPSGF